MESRSKSTTTLEELMNNARQRLLEIFEDNVYWEDDQLPDGGKLTEGEGPVHHLTHHDNGRLTFTCGDWSATIEADDLVEISGQCVVTYRTAGSGQQWVCVYGPAKDEVTRVRRERTTVTSA